MAKNLVIVESPAKAKTISKILGKDFTVKSSFGHIRDLPKDDSAIDIANNFTPRYIVYDEKEDVVKELQQLAKNAEVVWLASDEDREGEAISWHLFEALKLPVEKTKRIVFHEITEKAIKNAVANPRSIDRDLVDAQQARRVLDRLVGFELSPVLWKKVKPSLSAGRVQSVAVRLIVEKEKEIQAFTQVPFFKVQAFFEIDGKELKTELSEKFSTYEEAVEFMESCRNARFVVSNLEEKPFKKSPPAPFTTSTLQQEASRKLNFSIARTSLIAQKLYEAGHITYMRTDSVNLSELALDATKDEITSVYGDKYHKRRQYTTKTANAQEAHEAIRPTNFTKKSIGTDDPAEAKLYDLIFKRALASQMADAELNRTIVTIQVDRGNHIGNNITSSYTFGATSEIVVFDGFLKVYLESTDNEEDEESTLLPPINKGQVLKCLNIKSTERWSKPPARYTEASLVKKLEELGIGRPSTYSPTIQTILKREYVVKEDRPGKERKYRVGILNFSSNEVDASIKHQVLTETIGTEKQKLFPTDIGTVVTDYLMKEFNNELDYKFTATVEEQFDEIANGKLEWQKMIREFYFPFHERVQKAISSKTTERGERELGIDPASGKKVIVRLGRFGAVAQIGLADDDEKKIASLRPGQALDSLTLDEALELFKLPRELGEFEGKPMKVAIGRYGPYVQHDGSYYSLAQTDDPLTLTEERAVELILAKREGATIGGEGNKSLGTFEDKPVSVGTGRFGPYVFHDKKYYSISKKIDLSSLTIEAAIEHIEKKRIEAVEKVLRVFPEDEKLRILRGRWGNPFLNYGRSIAALPKGTDINALTFEECLALVKPQAKKAAKSDKVSDKNTEEKPKARKPRAKKN